ncbi:MAG: PAS domain S-box protein [Terriglobales bacterium]
MRSRSRKAAVSDFSEYPHYLKQIYEILPACNLIYADKDLVIRYMNQSSRNTLAKIEHLLPCKVDEIIGKSIDIFHKDPGRARHVLVTEKNLPHHAYFQLGPEKIEQTVHGVYDEKGALAGYATAWAIVTEEYRLEQAMQAIYQSRPCIEFDIEGNVVRANDLFLKLSGYTIEEITGKNHRIFVREADRDLPENAALWTKFEAGAAQSGEFRRLGKDGRNLWVACTYYPIPDIDGKIYRVMQFMTDITGRKLRDNDFAGQIQAIGRVQPVGEYNMDGTILHVNENFEKLLGYSRTELIGKHVSVFVDETTRQSAEYQAESKTLWEKLNRGEACNGEARRTTKQGREIWIQYSYNPILDLNCKPYKVVNYFRDITAQKLANADYQGQIAAIGKSQAVIEFRMDGTIIHANDNFLKAVGYRLEEIEGKHHSMFVDEAYRQSAAYQENWARLNRGEYVADEFKRIGKGGKEVWIQASYNPILDLNGKPARVVEYSTDITSQKVALNAMITDAMMLVEAAVDGKLSTRADASRHAGDYRKIVEGVNETLDAVITPLHEMGNVLADSQGRPHGSDGRKPYRRLQAAVGCVNRHNAAGAIGSAANCCQRAGTGFLGRGTVGDQRTDYGQFRGNDGAGENCRRSRGPGECESPDAFLGSRGDERDHRGDRQERDRGGESVGRSGGGGGIDQPNGEQVRRVEC